MLSQIVIQPIHLPDCGPILGDGFVVGMSPTATNAHNTCYMVDLATRFIFRNLLVAFPLLVV